jgi:hypothetical protein
MKKPHLPNPTINIKTFAAENNVSVSAACKLAGIREDTVSRWKNRTPGVIKQHNKVIDAIAQIAADRNSAQG